MALELCPVAANARRFPEQQALSWAGRSIAWDALNNYVHSTSRYLKEISVRSDDTVMVVAERSPACVIVLLALWRIGAVPCLLAPSVFAENMEAVIASLKPAMIVGPRNLRKTFGRKGQGVRSADIEQVVAYGYNDSFLGSEAALDPKMDSGHPALVRLEFAGGEARAARLTHQELHQDPGELAELFAAFKAGTTYNI